MSEYTSTIEGYQRAMKWGLTGPPHEAKEYAKAVTAPTFYHTANGNRISYDENIKYMEEWRAKTSDYEPVVYVEYISMCVVLTILTLHFHHQARLSP